MGGKRDFKERIREMSGRERGRGSRSECGDQQAVKKASYRKKEVD